MGEDIGEQDQSTFLLVYGVTSENKSEKCNSLRKLQKTSAQLDPARGCKHSGFYCLLREQFE